jgi:hypothetical protein
MAEVRFEGVKRTLLPRSPTLAAGTVLTILATLSLGRVGVLTEQHHQRHVRDPAILPKRPACRAQ